MRSRVLAVLGATALAATPAVVVATNAAGATKHKAKAGQKCSPKKKAPKGFKCKKNAKGKYVLVKSKAKG